MLVRLIMISQAMWDEAMRRLGISEDKFWNIEGGVMPRVDTRLEDQDRRVQGWLDPFE